MLKQGEQNIMQFKQMLKASLVPRRNIFASLVMVGLVASVMGLTPTHGAANTLAQDCPNPPTTPTFNYWPVTYDDVNTPFCHDFPAIDAAIDQAHPQWSQSQADWDNGLTLNVGDNALAGIYIHNGAANNLDPQQTTAEDVHIITSTDTTVGSSHRITVTFTASNADTYTKSFTVYTPADAHLEVVPNSGKMYDYQGRLILSQQNLNLGNSDYDGLGYLDACFEYSLFLTYKFKVVRDTTPTTTLSIDKKVKNLTEDPNTGRGAVYYDSVNAKKNERVGYRIAVTNTGTTAATNVTVSDNGVSGITVDSGSTTVGIADDSQITGWTGALPGTVNLGTLQPGEVRIVKYTGTVTTSDCPTLTNTAYAKTGVTQVSDTAQVKVIDCRTTHDNPKIKIQKWVKNVTDSTSYDDDQVNARDGDRVNFKITVSNTGDSTLTNVRMTDRIPDGLRFDDNVSGDGTPTFSSTTFSVDFGSIRAGDSKTVQFNAKVDTNNDSTTICNVAKATANNVSQVEDDACVKITTRTTHNDGTPNIVLSKRAWNDTKNIDATTVSAARGDYITYTLVTTNNGSADKSNFVISDDLSQILPLADMVSTNGGTLSGNKLSYPAMTIREGETVTKTFKVRIKQTLDKNLSYQLRNTYGNTIVINVPGEKVYQAPKTGAAGTSAVTFAGLLTAGFVVVRKRGSILKFIFA